jgi:hypothetical protein
LRNLLIGWVVGCLTGILAVPFLLLLAGGGSDGGTTGVSWTEGDAAWTAIRYDCSEPLLPKPPGSVYEPGLRSGGGGGIGSGEPGAGR